MTYRDPRIAKTGWILVVAAMSFSAGVQVETFRGEVLSWVALIGSLFGLAGFLLISIRAIWKVP
jgi:nicotinamide riboside transporter PnuC